VGIAVASVLLLTGCTAEPPALPTAPAKSQAVAGGSDLSQALSAARRLAEGADEESTARAIFYLNQWMNEAKGAAADWKPDRMVDSIPRPLRITPGLGQLDSAEFIEQDLRQLFDDVKKMQDEPNPQQAFLQRVGRFHQDLTYLQQVLWLADVAGRAKRQPPPAELAEWLKEIEKSVGLPEAEQLAAAERLFDWTVCNLQLDPLPPVPKGPVATVGQGGEPAVPALTGEVGPGYAHTPGQLLMQGHGDAHERARLFVLLCRQAGIDAVILGRIDETVSPAPQPWVAAVLIGEELYLFEPELGLPIPGPDGKGIATLSQALADDAVLKQLDVPDGPQYAHSPASLKALAALIDAEPASLSQRMMLLEKALPSSRRLVLAAAPSALEPRLRKCKGISTVSLWRAPFEAILYQIGRPVKLSRDPALSLQFEREDAIFLMPGDSLLRGRNQHLQGKFETSDDQVGARTEYLRSRLSDAERNLLYTSADFRRLKGFTQPLPEDEALKAQVLETLVTRFQRRKQHATFWLGLTYFEEGKYESAIEWLDERTLRAPLPSPWAAGARYNLARCHEALGHWDQARELLASDDSPQRHGNLLRAAWIAKRHDSK
jgi:hypothetical protein